MDSQDEAKILVIGGFNGFVGSNVTEALVNSGRQCVVTRHRSKEAPGYLTKFVGSSVFVEDADATSLPDLRRIGENHRIESIVDVSGAFHADARSPIPDLKAYFDRLIGVFQVAEDWKVRRVTFSSTVGMYLGLPESSVREDMPLPLPSFHPLVAYQKIVEIAAAEFARGSSISTVCARLGGMFGPGQPPSGGVVSELVHAAVNGRPAALEGAFFAGAEDAGEYWYIKDLARAVAALHTSDKVNHQVYNVGPGRSTPNMEVVEAIRRVVPGAVLQLPAGKSPFPPLPVMDVERLRADTGFSPHYDIQSAIADYVGWLRAGNPK